MVAMHMLEAALPWKSLLRGFIERCAASGAKEQADRLREARLLFQFDGSGTYVDQADLPDDNTLEGMLDRGAHESAALALLGADTAFMISRSSGGNCLASVVLRGQDGEMTEAGATLALALLAAKAAALLACDKPSEVA
jgi:hypothetical protein